MPSYKKSCFACHNLLICGYDMKRTICIVRCVQKKIENGRMFLLIDMLDDKIESAKVCATFENMKPPKCDTWKEYLVSLRHNFT